MATVTELVNQICEDTGLDSGSGSVERGIVLARLNNAYRQIMSRAGGVPAEVSVTFTDGQNYYDLSSDATLGTRFLSIQGVLDADGRSLPRETRGYCNHRAGLSSTTAGAIGSYCVEWPRLYVDADASSTTLTLDARLMPLVLEEDAGGSGETTPSALPPAWHEQLLASLATCLVLEKYEGREAEAVVHKDTYREAWSEYLLARSREGGVNGPTETATRSRFVVPSPSRIRR